MSLLESLSCYLQGQISGLNIFAPVERLTEPVTCSAVWTTIIIIII